MCEERTGLLCRTPVWEHEGECTVFIACVTDDCTDTEGNKQYSAHSNIVVLTEEGTAHDIKLFRRRNLEIKCLFFRSWAVLKMSLLLLHAAELLLHYYCVVWIWDTAADTNTCWYPHPNLQILTRSTSGWSKINFHQDLLIFLDIQMYLITNTLNTNLRCMKCKNVMCVFSLLISLSGLWNRRVDSEQNHGESVWDRSAGHQSRVQENLRVLAALRHRGEEPFH